MEPALSFLARRWRTRVRLHALRFVSLVIAVVLPLQGISGAVAAIQAPAHYHLRTPSSPAVTHAAMLSHVTADLPQPAYSSIATVHSPARSARHSHDATSTHAKVVPVILRRSAHGHSHSHHATPPVRQAAVHVHGQQVYAELPAAPVAPASKQDHADHHAIDIDAGRPGSPIGHHAHAFADAGVVYLDSSPDRPDGGSAAGKHTVTTDAALTGWWMPLRSAMGMQSLPTANWRYRSHLDAPALRPPAASDAPTA